jgi:hypothetical protein
MLLLSVIRKRVVVQNKSNLSLLIIWNTFTITIFESLQKQNKLKKVIEMPSYFGHGLLKNVS